MSARLLIVEDEVLSAMLLQNLLEDLGYVVCDLVTRAEDILPVAEREKPALILMDANLHGEMAGIPSARLIFQKLGIPSILVSGYPEKDLQKPTPGSGIIGFHPKPYDKRLLGTLLHNTLGSRK